MPYKRAALFAGGVCFMTLLPVSAAFSAQTPGANDSPRPAGISAPSNMKPVIYALQHPTRKPGGPGVRMAAERKNPKQKKAVSTSARDKKLCRALRACRIKFVSCKAKIKHPDQSTAWSVAKEVCGAHYKSCVEKDFKGGDWFFTRWFYFGKLDCS